MPMIGSGATFKMCSIQSKSHNVWQCLPTSRFAMWVICQQRPPCSIISRQKCSCKRAGWFLQTIGLRDFGVRSRPITNHVLRVVSLFKAHAICVQIFVHMWRILFPSTELSFPSNSRPGPYVTVGFLRKVPSHLNSRNHIACFFPKYFFQNKPCSVSNLQNGSHYEFRLFLLLCGSWNCSFTKGKKQNKNYSHQTGWQNLGVLLTSLKPVNKHHNSAMWTR